MKNCAVCGNPLELLNPSGVCADCERRDFSGNNRFWNAPVPVRNPGLSNAAMTEALDDCEQSELVNLLKDYDERHPRPEPQGLDYYADGDWDDDWDDDPPPDRRHPLDQLLNITPPPTKTNAIDCMMWNYLHHMDVEVTAEKAQQAVEKIKEDSDDG